LILLPGVCAFWPGTDVRSKSFTSNPLQKQQMVSYYGRYICVSSYRNP
jgi:hypothetical protein